jgi:hypothetical protein
MQRLPPWLGGFGTHATSWRSLVQVWCLWACLGTKKPPRGVTHSLAPLLLCSACPASSIPIHPIPHRMSIQKDCGVDMLWGGGWRMIGGRGWCRLWFGSLGWTLESFGSFSVGVEVGTYPTLTCPRPHLPFVCRHQHCCWCPRLSIGHGHGAGNRARRLGAGSPQGCAPHCRQNHVHAAGRLLLGAVGCLNEDSIPPAPDSFLSFVCYDCVHAS